MVGSFDAGQDQAIYAGTQRVRTNHMLGKNLTCGPLGNAVGKVIEPMHRERRKRLVASRPRQFPINSGVTVGIWI